jgi:hypothetical protein
MPSVSTDNAQDVHDYGPVLERSSELEGYAVNFVSFHEDSDITTILTTLPAGKCTCPHWGYLFSGQINVVYDTGEQEVIEAGHAYYIPPGHTSWKATGGTEMLQFSPADQLAEVDAAIAAAMHASPAAAPSQG